MTIDFPAAIFRSVDTPLSVETVSLPDNPGPGEVLVEIVAAGACHSDLHVINGEWGTPLPIILGHEGAGKVVAVGRDVDHLTVDDHVIVSWTPSCGKCVDCISGRPVLCQIAHEFAYASVSRDGKTRVTQNEDSIYSYLGAGTFGRYALIPQEAAIRIRKDAPLQQAALVGCAVATGVGAAVNTARVRPGQSVLVIGCGGVGVNTIQGAKLAGAATIIAVDMSDDKLRSATVFGATHTINAGQVDTVDAVKDLTAGRGVDYAFEAIGLARTIEAAFACTARGGATVLVGQVAEGVTITLDPFVISNEEKRVIGCNYGSSIPAIDFPRIVDLYMEDKLKLDELITARISLPDLNTAFEAMSRGEGIRTLIDHI